MSNAFNCFSWSFISTCSALWINALAVQRSNKKAFVFFNQPPHCISVTSLFRSQMKFCSRVITFLRCSPLWQQLALVCIVLQWLMALKCCQNQNKTDWTLGWCHWCGRTAGDDRYICFWCSSGFYRCWQKPVVTLAFYNVGLLIWACFSLVKCFWWCGQGAIWTLRLLLSAGDIRQFIKGHLRKVKWVNGLRCFSVCRYFLLVSVSFRQINGRSVHILY